MAFTTRAARSAALRTLAWATVLWLVAVQAAWACPVCFSAKNEDNQIAYLATTGLLTFLPLIMIGGLVLWVRRKVSELAALGGAAGEEGGGAPTSIEPR